MGRIAPLVAAAVVVLPVAACGERNEPTGSGVAALPGHGRLAERRQGARRPHAGQADRGDRPGGRSRSSSTSARAGRSPERPSPGTARSASTSCAALHARSDRRLLDDRRPADRAGRARRHRRPSSTARPTTPIRGVEGTITAARPDHRAARRRVAARPPDRGAARARRRRRLAGTPGVTRLRGHGLLHDRVRPVARRRHAARGARARTWPGTRRRWARSTRHSSPGSTRPGTWPRPTAARRSPACARTRRRASFAPSALGHFAVVDADLLDPGPTDRRRSRSRSLACSIRMRFAELDAVTVDGYGTLLHLVDPLPSLRRALAEHGVEQPDDAVATAFEAEVAHYRPLVAHGSRRREPRGAQARLRRRLPRRARRSASSPTRSSTTSSARSPSSRSPEPRRRSLGSRPEGSGWRWSRTGTARSRSTSSRRGCTVSSTRSSRRPGPASPSPTPAIFRARARRARRRAGSRPARRRRADRRGGRPRGRDSRFAPGPARDGVRGLGVTGRLAAWLALVGRPDPARLRDTRRAGKPDRNVVYHWSTSLPVHRLLRDLPRRSCS